MPRYVVELYFGCFVTVLLEEINVETGGLRVKQIVLQIWVGLIQSVEDLPRTERMTS